LVLRLAAEYFSVQLSLRWKSTTMEVLIMLVVLGVALVAAYLSYFSRQKRSREMAALAAQLGWQFRPDEDCEHDDVYRRFEIFRHGHSRYAYNTLSGSIEFEGTRWPVKLGDFHYQVTSHRGKRLAANAYRFSYILLQLPYATLPPLVVCRAGMSDEMKDRFALDDVELESPEFSRRFDVKSAQRQFACDVIRPQMMEFLLGYEPPTIDVEAGGCLLADGQNIWSPDEFRATLDWVRHFFALWPEQTTKQLQIH
jgi:hypothetical protein